MNPVWSPRGNEIAYHRYGNGDQPSIFITDSSGEHTRRLTDLENGHFHPLWSPCGTRVVFTVLQNGLRALYITDADDRRARRLLDVGPGHLQDS